MKKQKRIAAIHDISCVGRCSLTVILPILSSAGIDTGILPTAVLSTHTGGFENYTFRDLTTDMSPIAQHWKSLDLNFDSLYSGYLGSFEQIKLVEDIFDMFRTKDNLIMVDPVMADNGELYALFSEDTVRGMANLCKKADIIVPNITEAAFMTNTPYKEGPYEESYIKELLEKLADFAVEKIVLTGVMFKNEELGAAYYSKTDNKLGYVFSKAIPGHFHGTGDVFGSALLSGLLNGFSLEDSTKLAVDFTCECIKLTVEYKQENRYGVCFEKAIPSFIESLGLSK